ncbi:hypothetical protein [Pseudoroseomonas cervicalis]|nr:hypothetical protein [Pseudoroseomonas cervicalis]MDQ1078869.1 hypothetical protein [Pseudoroseomonas cervicalis]
MRPALLWRQRLRRWRGDRELELWLAAALSLGLIGLAACLPWLARA